MEIRKAIEIYVTIPDATSEEDAENILYDALDSGLMNSSHNIESWNMKFIPDYDDFAYPFSSPFPGYKTDLVKSVDDVIYTGGSINNYFGKLTNGNWFAASDADGYVCELDADPVAYMDESDSNDIWYSDWFDAHLVNENFSPNELKSLWASILTRLVEDGKFTSDEATDMLNWLTD